MKSKSYLTVILTCFQYDLAWTYRNFRSLKIPVTNSLQSFSNDEFNEMFPYVLTQLSKLDVLKSVDDIPSDYVNKAGKLGNKTVDFQCTLLEGSYFSKVRLVTFKGSAGFNVFNLLVLPNLNINREIIQLPLPILGVDIVVLPGSILASIDFQPSNNLSLVYFGPFYSNISKIYNKWKDYLPPGSELSPVITSSLRSKTIE